MPSPSAPSTRATRGGPERFGERGLRLAGQADPPEARLGDLVERAGEVDHAHPGHGLERAAGGLGERAGFGRRVAVLGDDAERVERGGRAQDRADIVRIGDLVEHQQRPAVLGLVEQVGEQHIGQLLDLGDDALVRRVARHQPAEVGDVGVGDREWRGSKSKSAAASRVAQMRTIARSGLASAAATAWRPQKRGRFSGLEAWRALRRIAAP